LVEGKIKSWKEKATIPQQITPRDRCKRSKKPERMTQKGKRREKTPKKYGSRSSLLIFPIA